MHNIINDEKLLSKQERKKIFYVERKELSDEIKRYYRTNVFSNKLGQFITKIAQGLRYSPNFINYTYKEDMISDAIINMFKSIKNKNFNFNKVKCSIAEENKKNKIKSDEEECKCKFILPPPPVLPPDFDELDIDPYPIKCPGCGKEMIPLKFSPFSYLTQIASYAFINRIKIENKNNARAAEYNQRLYEEIMINNPHYNIYVKQLNNDDTDLNYNE